MSKLSDYVRDVATYAKDAELHRAAAALEAAEGALRWIVANGGSVSSEKARKALSLISEESK